MGVALPPMSVPTESAHASVGSAVPVVWESVWITGSMVAANGMLSMKALATADTQMMMAIIRYALPEQILLMTPAMMVRMPVCSSPPTTTKSPMKKRIVL